MKYLERYAFQLIPDITRLKDFPIDINDETIADYFGLDQNDRDAIQRLHKKTYDNEVVKKPLNNIEIQCKFFNS